MIKLSYVIKNGTPLKFRKQVIKSKLFRIGFLRLCHLSDCLPVPTKRPERDCP